jgi:deoxyribodipyrimidine photo-lyase
MPTFHRVTFSLLNNTQTRAVHPINAPAHTPWRAWPQNGAMPGCLVWLKKDLRCRDHAPLAMAAGFEQAAALFVIEPEWLSSPEFDAQHLEFTLACLTPLRAALAARGLPLLVRVGRVADVFTALRREFAFTHLASHEETGPLWTYARDQQVARWCSHHGVQWQEFAQSGVVRRLKSRSGWAARWQRRMNAPMTESPAGFAGASGLEAQALPTLAQLGIAAQRRTLPRAGEAAAHETMRSFLHERGANYRQDLSSPLTAEQGCSRLSAHLAFGTLSMRALHQATEARIAALHASEDRRFASHLRGFAGRLRWHCHFMQKLEDEPQIEQRNFARVCDGLREEAFNRERFEAWCEGRTGYPMVDACMRSLRATGWLNFRMRAMLVSFAAYHLWLHWREPGLFLARQFLDFEPGIHWSQMQMQSGTTGINTLRMYSPAKQAADHDPSGAFVRRWVPEIGTAAYPKPIVVERDAMAQAKSRLYALRGTTPAREEAQAIQNKHGSRKSGLPPTKRPRAKAADTNQRSLFE